MSYVHQIHIETRAAAATPTDEDMAILRSADYAGPGTADDALRVREMLLCHDQYDRTGERFTPAYLTRFAETLPGKSVLAGHDNRTLPLARFFRGHVEQRRETGFPTLTQPGKGYPAQAGKSEIVPGFEPRNRTVRWLKAGFYYPPDEGLDSRIETGVYRSVSIGFRFDDLDCDVCKKSYFSDCPHLMMQELEDGRRVTGTYSGDAMMAEALEGSIVYLGAQPQARIIKDTTGALIDDPECLAKLPWGVDAIALKCYEEYARRTGYYPRRVFAVPGGLPHQPHPGPEPGAGEADMDADKAAALETEIAALRTKTAQQEPLAEIGRKALDAAATRYLTAANRCGRNDVEAKALAGYYQSRQDYDGLSVLAEALEAEAAKFPSKPSADVAAATTVEPSTKRTAADIRAAAGA